VSSNVPTQVTTQINTTLQTLYPVGSIYIGTMETCPFAALFGTWELKSQGRVLQGADNDHEVGTTIAAGLPNITGELGNIGFNRGGAVTTGAFAYGYNHGDVDFNNAGGYVANFDASRSSSIYGNSTTVQPPAYVVNIWERVA
jgi:hypothetical protein